ncbi:hypothetical protein [Aciditerrimonas ferrireducens]|uniref:hypothetical protein n=1 Tax=Aciditerrimonas ferrireducens TaxID=667306 RepID=UPI002004E198|nr:hypothetical protein [Aciditerrimonas ferrireducens]MCK4177087.1 hypothetical protein [Aciditerrimonas ferrireducens]
MSSAGAGSAALGWLAPRLRRLAGLASITADPPGPLPLPAPRAARLADRLEEHLLALFLVVGGLGVAMPGLGRALDRGGAVDPTLAVLVLAAGTAVVPPSRLADFPWRRALVGLVGSSVLLPLLADGLAHLASGPSSEGLLALGVASSEVASIGLVGLAGGDGALAAVLVAGSTAVTVALASPVLGWLSGGRHVEPGGLLVTLLLVVALPFAAGIVLRRASRAAPATTEGVRLLGLLALLLLLLEVASQVRLGLAALRGIALLLAFLAGSLLLAWLLARGCPGDQGLGLLLPLTMRDFAVAAGIATAAFGPRASGLLGAYGLLALLLGGLLARGAGRRLLSGPARPPASGGPRTPGSRR